jgi:hypothetical protein
MPGKHTWTFKVRLRSGVFGWKGSHLASNAGQILSIRLTTPSAAVTGATLAIFLISATASFKRKQALRPVDRSAERSRGSIDVFDRATPSFRQPPNGPSKNPFRYASTQ